MSQLLHSKTFGVTEEFLQQLHSFAVVDNPAHCCTELQEQGVGVIGTVAIATPTQLPSKTNAPTNCIRVDR